MYLRILILVLTVLSPLQAADPTHLMPQGESPPDARLQRKPKTLNDDFPFMVPDTKAAWDDRRAAVRRQVLVATGLWPMPARTAIQPVIHGRIQRDGYTIDKVYFASLPGHYVTGNLYRPTNSLRGKYPGVLCPHGHWSNGRLYDAGAKDAKRQMEQGGETNLAGARHPLQARCVQLTRMGCVVFHYDMVGYADSQAIAHRQGFTDCEAELRLQSFMGLQTWNSIRALDFLLSLPEVDDHRIGVTGASGGGTQTFILAAVDERPTVAFPAVMVSTAMQGGCICENCSYLRLGTGNIELAGLFAPKPLAMSGANDWTKEIETKGFPELKKLYALYNAEDRVKARCWPQFGHNFNQRSREMMYAWFNRHLFGNVERVKEQPFQPVPPEQLRVFNAAHPRPADSLNAKQLRAYLTERDTAQLEADLPSDSESLRAFQKTYGPAWQTLVGSMPQADSIEAQNLGIQESPDWIMQKRMLNRRPDGAALPMVLLKRAAKPRRAVLWIHPDGKSSLFKDGQPVAAVRELLQAGNAVVAVDLFGTGELVDGKGPTVDQRYAGYTFAYNSPLLRERVQDILTAIRYTRQELQAEEVHLVGQGSAGPWTLLALTQATEEVDRAAIDLNRFSFASVRRADHPMLLPGALKYGGLGVAACLSAPTKLWLYNLAGERTRRWSKAGYAAQNVTEQLTLSADPPDDLALVRWLTH